MAVGVMCRLGKSRATFLLLLYEQSCGRAAVVKRYSRQQGRQLLE